MPLFILQGAFFPQGTTYLNVFEMKYRTMMFDVANSDDMFGYIHSNPETGQIAAIGTLCKITDRQLLEDGRQYISLEGKSRFRVTKILKTLPYVLAEVDLDFSDQPVDEALADKIERQTYDALKYYIRLMRTYDANKDMVICSPQLFHTADFFEPKFVFFSKGHFVERKKESTNKFSGH